VDRRLALLETTVSSASLERRLDELFDRELLELAVARVRERVAAPTWEAFRLTTFEGHSGAEAARLLGIPVASVFVSKHRVQKMLREEIARLEGAGEEEATPALNGGAFRLSVSMAGSVRPAV